MKITSTCRNPVRVGSVIVRPGLEVEVILKEFNAFLATDSGKSISGLFFKKVSQKKRSKNDS